MTPLLTIALGLVGLVLADPPATSIKEGRETLRSHGKEIAIDLFTPEPATPEPLPAIILIHGNNAIGDDNRSLIHDEARIFAKAGYLAIVPHYFDRAKPDPKNARKNTKTYGQWVQTIREVVSFAAEHEGVDARRIGLYGVSLGSWLTFSVAAQDRRIRAVVEWYGGFPHGEALDPSRLPPTLILHGDADNVVKVEEAHRLDEILSQAGIEHEMKIYEGAGHGFMGAEREDGLERTLAFFAERLKKPAVGETEAGTGAARKRRGGPKGL